MKLQRKKDELYGLGIKIPRYLLKSKTSFYKENQFLKLTIGKDERELQILKNIDNPI